ncbi:MAG: division/cell wall cluster transcriptional repressor MraZ [Alphaproteobacteria bacterium]|nr:division/cell wall cluster transcriptional repressor MraZ [Alphaproteobacteria bacterium]
MALFVSTFVNRIDRKGRVSVPATFRAALKGQDFEGIVAFPALGQPAMEGCGMDFMERLSASVDSFDMFSPRRDELAAVVFADAHQLPFDGEGRVVLPPALIGHCGIEAEVAFVGRGRTFQIWEPVTFRRHAEEVRGRALSVGATLPVRPAAPGGNAP